MNISPHFHFEAAHRVEHHRRYLRGGGIVEIMKARIGKSGDLSLECAGVQRLA
jgi:hypothetical protein